MKSIENLERYCSSDDLSFDGIKCALGYFVPRDHLHKSNLLHRVCLNPDVTLEMVEYLVNLIPDMVGMKRDIKERGIEGAYPLYVGCTNEHCPNSVVKFLMESRIDDIMICPELYWGLPLHRYLSRTENADIEIVKYMVAKYHTPLNVLQGLHEEEVCNIECTKLPRMHSTSPTL